MRHASEIVQSQIANGLSIAGQQPHLKNFSFSLREVRGNVKRRGLRSCSIAPKKPSVPLDRWVLKKERKKQLLFDGERESWLLHAHTRASQCMIILLDSLSILPFEAVVRYAHTVSVN